MKRLFVFLGLLTVRCLADDPVAAWSKDVVIKPMSVVEGRHSIHSYYVANPDQALLPGMTGTTLLHGPTKPLWRTELMKPLDFVSLDYRL